MLVEEALTRIRLIPDYPSEGILFRDITPLLSDNEALASVTHELANSPFPYSHVAGLEARGFILAAAVAAKTNKGFIPFRKKGKLPFTTHSRSYELEYGTATIEAHIDAASPHDSILLIDDVLATGGTALAGLHLIQSLGSECKEVAFLLEIEALGGRAKIISEFPNIAIRSLSIV